MHSSQKTHFCISSMKANNMFQSSREYKKKIFKTKHFYKTLYYSTFCIVIKSKNQRHIHAEMLFAVGQLFLPVSAAFGLLCLTWIIYKEKYTFLCACARQDSHKNSQKVSISPVRSRW